MEAKPTAQADELGRELAGQAGTIDELHGVMKSALGCMLDAEVDARPKRHDGPCPSRRTRPTTAAAGTRARPLRANSAKSASMSHATAPSRCFLPASTDM